MQGFSVPPYAAERQIFTSTDDGGMSSSWEPCMVIGITSDSDGEPAYLIEFYSCGDSFLAIEPYVRRRS